MDEQRLACLGEADQILVQAIEDVIDRELSTPEEKTLAIYAENTHWGRSLGEAIRSQLEAESWTTVTEEYVSLDEVGFLPTLNKFQAQNVALVAATTTSMPSFAAFINQANEIGLNGLIIADGLGWSGEWYRMTREPSEHVIDQIPGWATVEGKQFAGTFEERWVRGPAQFVGGRPCL